MKPADDGAYLLLAGEPSRVSHRVDDAGMTAAAQHDQPSISEAQDQRLVVEDQWIRRPAIVAERLMPGTPGLERLLAIDLAGDERGSVEQKRRLAFFDDREPPSPRALRDWWLGAWP